MTDEILEREQIVEAREEDFRKLARPQEAEERRAGAPTEGDEDCQMIDNAEEIDSVVQAHIGAVTDHRHHHLPGKEV